ncbi:MAG: hypothetical protein H0X51_10145 [Parachlamydiaceae bacterium]|nr:hypothetical protein [Tatlockia sp.]MBA3958736.1 hypothetical protein [Parachlamydiaceae bacterium]
MEKLKKYLLKQEYIFEYFFEHVQSGNELSKKIINNIDFDRGSFYTVLPSDANLERLYVLTSGNIIPQKHPKISMEDEEGNKYIHQKVMSTEKDFTKFIWDYLKINHSHLAVFEDVMSSLKDPNLEIDQVRLVTINDHVYYLADYLASLSSVRDALWSAEEVWHMLIVLTKELVSQSLPDTLSVEDLKLICDSTQYIIISAYDGESYIIWEKHGQTWQYPGFELTELPSNISFLEPEQSG